jgi:calcineurin-like phosphoesterase
MTAIDDPFPRRGGGDPAVQRELHHFVDFHAEATSEKVAMAISRRPCDGRRRDAHARANR